MYTDGIADIPSSTLSALFGFVNKVNKIVSAAGYFVATKVVFSRK
jgi:hypothetical protein